MNEEVAILLHDEVRTVDPKTGGEKGLKLDRYDLIPAEVEEALANHYGMGAKKYADRNWERGYAWGLSYRALRSHLNKFVQGERYDNHTPSCPPGCVNHTGTHHMICVMWHAVALFIFDIRRIGTDNLTKLSDTPR